LIRGVAPELLSLFLVLTQEKEQKKVKAPGTPAKLAWYTIIFITYPANFPASVEAAGQIIRVPQKYSTCPYLRI